MTSRARHLARVHGDPGDPDPMAAWQEHKRLRAKRVYALRQKKKLRGKGRHTRAAVKDAFEESMWAVLYEMAE